MKHRKLVMIITILLVIVLGLGLSSTTPNEKKCYNYDKDIVWSTNQAKLPQLIRLMPKESVIAIFDTSAKKDPFTGTTIANPYRTELIKTKENKNGSLYEVYFYHTCVKKNDGVITNDELTPIIFNEGKTVEGWGWQYLYYVTTHDQNYTYPNTSR